MSTSQTTSADRTSAFFIGFFTFLGTVLGVVFVVFLVVTFSHGEAGLPSWLRPLLRPALFVSPALGLAAGWYAAARYLRTRRQGRG